MRRGRIIFPLWSGAWWPAMVLLWAAFFFWPPTILLDSVYLAGCFLRGQALCVCMHADNWDHESAVRTYFVGHCWSCGFRLGSLLIIIIIIFPLVFGKYLLDSVTIYPLHCCNTAWPLGVHTSVAHVPPLKGIRKHLRAWMFNSQSQTQHWEPGCLLFISTKSAQLRKAVALGQAQLYLPPRFELMDKMTNHGQASRRLMAQTDPTWWIFPQKTPLDEYSPKIPYLIDIR